MNQTLFDVSAKAFQKHLEEEANFKNNDDLGGPNPGNEIVQLTTSILSRLASLFGGTKRA